MEEVVRLGEYHPASAFYLVHRCTEMIVYRRTFKQALFYPFFLSDLVISALQNDRQVFYQKYTAKNGNQQLLMYNDSKYGDNTADGQAPGIAHEYLRRIGIVP